MSRSESHPVVHTLKASVLYFALVFGAGFVLGPIRIHWAVPRVGPRMAELMEMPIMLAVIIVAARWTVRHLGVPATAARRLGMGSAALALLLAAEFALAFWVRGLRIPDYVASLDPVAGLVYAGALGAFAVMPLLVGRSPDRRNDR